MTMSSIYDRLANAEYRIERDDEGLLLRLYAPKSGTMTRKNAFIRPDPELVKEKGPDIYTRLNMPDPDRKELEAWVNKFLSI